MIGQLNSCSRKRSKHYFAKKMSLKMFNAKVLEEKSHFQEKLAGMFLFLDRFSAGKLIG